MESKVQGDDKWNDQESKNSNKSKSGCHQLIKVGPCNNLRKEMRETLTANPKPK